MFISASFLLEEILDPTNGPLVHRRSPRANGCVAVAVVPKFGSPAQQPYGCRIRGPAHRVAHPDGLRRRPDPDRKIEERLRRFREPEQPATAAGENDAAGQEAIVPAATHLEAHHLEDLAGPRRDDLRQVPARHDLHAILPDLVQLDHLLSRNARGDRMPIVDLQHLGFGEGGAQPDGDIARHVRRAYGQDRGVHHAAVGEERDVGRATADIDQGHAQVQLIVVEDGLGRGQHLHHQVLDAHARLVDTLDNVLHRGQRPGDDVGFDFEPGAGHADRIPDPFLTVDDVAAWDDVDDLAIVGDGDRARGVDHPADVVLPDLAVRTGHRDDPTAVLAEDVGAGHADEGRLELVATHPLRGIDRVADAPHGLLHVDDHAATQTFGGCLAESDDVETAFRRLADDAADLGCADI